MFYAPASRARPGSRGKLYLAGAGGNFGLKIAGTFNDPLRVFDAPLLMNITNAASAAGSVISDFQIGGTSVFQIDKSGNALHGNGLNAIALRVYNTVDALANPTNYERGTFDWTTTTNTLTIGTQAGGTGTSRSLSLNAAGGNLNLQVAGTTFLLIQFNLVQTNALFRVGANLDFGGGGTGTYLSALNNFGVLQIGQAGGAANAGWLNYGGQIRSTVDFSVASSTTMTTSTSSALSVPLFSSRNYTFEACIFSTCSTTGGIALALQSTTITGSTDLRWHAYTLSNNTLAGEVFSTVLGSSATLSGPVTLLPSTTNVVTYINGTITNLASNGNLQIWFAQNTSTSVASVVKRGSYLWVHDMP